MLESTWRSAGPVNGKVILNESYLQTFCGTACNVVFRAGYGGLEDNLEDCSEDCLEDLGICLVGPMRRVLGIHHFIEAVLGTEMIIEANTNTIDNIKLVDEIPQK